MTKPEEFARFFTLIDTFIEFIIYMVTLIGRSEGALTTTAIHAMFSISLFVSLVTMFASKMSDSYFVLSCFDTVSILPAWIFTFQASFEANLFFFLYATVLLGMITFFISFLKGKISLEAGMASSVPFVLFTICTVLFLDHTAAYVYVSGVLWMFFMIFPF